MKNYFLFLLLLVVSLYSVSALYQGMLNVDLGDSLDVEMGETPSVIVTDNSGSSGSSSGNGGGGGGTTSSGSSGSFVEVFNQELKINEKGEIIEKEVKKEEINSQKITGGVIGFVKEPIVLISTMTFAVLTLILTLLIVLKRNRN